MKGRNHDEATNMREISPYTGHFSVCCWHHHFWQKPYKGGRTGLAHGLGEFQSIILKRHVGAVGFIITECVIQGPVNATSGQEEERPDLGAVLQLGFRRRSW